VFADASQEHALRAGIISVVKLLQRVIVDVHLLFLSTVDLPAVLPAAAGAQAKAATQRGAPVLGLVAVYQKVLLQETAEQLERYVNAGAANAPVLLVFDIARACQELLLGDGASSVGVGHAALLREQRKSFRTWLETTLEAVTTRCKAVLSSLSSAGEVALLQQQVWSACTHIVEYTAVSAHSVMTARNALGLDEQLATHFAYTQKNWEAASAAVLGPGAASHTSSGKEPSGSNIAHTYLWSNVFRACFLHQVERLLKCSCDEVLAHTKLNILRVLRQQGVAVDAHTLRITTPATGAADNATATGKKRSFDLTDFSGDASQLSSPAIYQMAEKIRLQFEQDLSRLLADVIDPVRTPSCIPNVADIVAT
jgi:hypothetical protein